MFRTVQCRIPRFGLEASVYLQLCDMPLSRNVQDTPLPRGPSRCNIDAYILCNAVPLRSLFYVNFTLPRSHILFDQFEKHYSSNHCVPGTGFVGHWNSAVLTHIWEKCDKYIYIIVHGLDPWEESNAVHELVKARNLPCLGMVMFARVFSCTFGPNRTQTLLRR